MSETSSLPGPTLWRDAQLALWNALKIGASLLATWTVAVLVRFTLPRLLGPDQYGVYNFTEAFATSFFVLASLGIETYVQKEIPLRADHATDFFGGVLAIRLALGAALLAAMAVILHFGGRPPEVRLMVYLFAAGQLLFVSNATFAAMLQARGTVDGLSVINVLAKLLWGAGILVALTSRAGLLGLAAAFALAEAIKAGALFSLCRRHLSLRLRIDLGATKRVIACSFPFFVTTLSTTLFSKLDDTLLGFLANDREVGWFGVASNLSLLGLLMTPLVGSVLLPLFSRVAARSQGELDHVMRRSLEVILMVAIPASLALGLGADVWVRVVGGPDYGPAALSLRILSPVFVLTYVGMLCASCLYVEGRSWRVTWVCLGGLAVNAILNATLIRHMLAVLGPGGAGVGAALATVGTETFTCALFALAIGRRVLDGRLLSTVARLAGVCAAVIALDRACASLGPSRLLLDAAAYVALAFLTGAVRVGEIREFVTVALKVKQSTG
jgi:O-antigen/teichoic acid export membrane protein